MPTAANSILYRTLHVAFFQRHDGFIQGRIVSREFQRKRWPLKQFRWWRCSGAKLSGGLPACSLGTHALSGATCIWFAGTLRARVKTRQSKTSDGPDLHAWKIYIEIIEKHLGGKTVKFFHCEFNGCCRITPWIPPSPRIQHQHVVNTCQYCIASFENAWCGWYSLTNAERKHKLKTARFGPTGLDLTRCLWFLTER